MVIDTRPIDSIYLTLSIRCAAFALFRGLTKDFYMAGVRTAPAFTAAATRRIITLHVIDSSGDYWAEDWDVPVAATAANIETWAAAYAAATQSSLWMINDQQMRVGQDVATNATTDQRNQASQGVNALFGNNTTNVSRTLRLVAPITAVMDGNQDLPLMNSTEMAALTAATAVISPAGTFLQSGQYTDRRERKNNKRVKA